MRISALISNFKPSLLLSKRDTPPSVNCIQHLLRPRPSPSRTLRTRCKRTTRSRRPPLCASDRLIPSHPHTFGGVHDATTSRAASGACRSRRSNFYRTSLAQITGHESISRCLSVDRVGRKLRKARTTYSQPSKAAHQVCAPPSFLRIFRWKARLSSTPIARVDLPICPRHLLPYSG